MFPKPSFLPKKRGKKKDEECRAEGDWCLYEARLCSEIYIRGLLVQIWAWVVMQNEKSQSLTICKLKSQKWQ